MTLHNKFSQFVKASGKGLKDITTHVFSQLKYFILHLALVMVF